MNPRYVHISRISFRLFLRVYHLFSSVDSKYYNMFDSVCQGHSLTVSNLQY